MGIYFIDVGHKSKFKVKIEQTHYSDFDFEIILKFTDINNDQINSI